MIRSVAALIIKRKEGGEVVVSRRMRSTAAVPPVFAMFVVVDAVQKAFVHAKDGKLESMRPRLSPMRSLWTG